jgi:hypothetical protein
LIAAIQTPVCRSRGAKSQSIGLGIDVFVLFLRCCFSSLANRFFDVRLAFDRSTKQIRQKQGWSPRRPLTDKALLIEEG